VGVGGGGVKKGHCTGPFQKAYESKPRQVSVCPNNEVAKKQPGNAVELPCHGSVWGQALKGEISL